jgi:hypothetical protein
MSADPVNPPDDKPSGALLRLCVSAEAGPGAIACVLERFQILNITPRRVIAESDIFGRMEIVVDIFGLSERRLTLIAAKIGQIPCVLNAHCCRT